MALTKIQAAGLTADLIDETKLADDSIDSEHYNAASIDNEHLADDAVGVAELSATGTASSSTFLRGDNSWVTPTDTNTVYTHPNHSGEVTSTADGATVIADDIVDEANLKISNAGSNGQFLSKQSGDTGGLTWATVDTSLADNSVTLAKMAGLARGKIIYGDASGDPAALTVGSANQVLTSDGTDVAWAAAAGGLYSAWAQVYEQNASTGTDGGTFTSGAMRTRTLNTEEDPSNIVSLSSNQFTLGAGTYVIKWSAPAYQVSQHTTLLWDATNSAIKSYGSAAYSYYSSNNAATRSHGLARVTITGDTAFEIHHQAGITANTHGFGPGMGGRTYKFTIVEILKEA
tara:strand:- start:586 stop:1620 length:1035 start_codon:yes stop_codon:yes gene_type:complete